jgi:hypothetical protein
VDHWRVKIEDVSRHLRSQGSWARDMFLGLDVDPEGDGTFPIETSARYIGYLG